MASDSMKLSLQFGFAAVQAAESTAMSPIMKKQSVGGDLVEKVISHSSTSLLPWCEGSEFIFFFFFF